MTSLMGGCISSESGYLACAVCEQYLEPCSKIEGPDFIDSAPCLVSTAASGVGIFASGISIFPQLFSITPSGQQGSLLLMLVQARCYARFVARCLPLHELPQERTPIRNLISHSSGACLRFTMAISWWRQRCLIMPQRA